jgi:hypothetical protein
MTQLGLCPASLCAPASSNGKLLTLEFGADS